MGFPTVKSNPYHAGLRLGRKRRRHLWTEAQWTRLCKQAKDDHGTFDPDEYPISEQCLELIADFNRYAEAA